METKKIALAASLIIGITSFVYWDTYDYFKAVRIYKTEMAEENVIARNMRFVEEANLVMNCGSLDVINEQHYEKMDRECFTRVVPQLQDGRSIVFAVIKASEWLQLNPNDTEIVTASNKALDVAWLDAPHYTQISPAL